MSPPEIRDPIKVYDARWQVEEFGDAQVVRLFEATLAYGRELGADTVTLCRDARLAAGHVQELGVETALALGYRVFARTDPLSTPQSYFTTLTVAQRFPNVLGLTVTASHNPAGYIGLKFTVPPLQAIGLDCGPQGGLTRIRALYHSGEPVAPRPGGALHILDLGREYLDFAMAHAGLASGELAGLRVALDAFNGSAGPELHRLLERAGVEVHSLRLVPDGSFPSGSPNPTSQAKMDRALELARTEELDAMIGLDGDGDRIVFGDCGGPLSAGLVALPLIRAAGLDSAGARVLHDPKVSPLALAEWGRLGVDPILFRNGHSQIKDYMSQSGIDLGAEESGHYFHRLRLGDLSVCAECSALTILLFLRALKSDPALKDELGRLRDAVFTSGEFNIQFADEPTRDDALAAALEHLRSQGAEILTQSPDHCDLQGTIARRGLRFSAGHIELEPGWFNAYLRVATNERAVVRSYLSSGDEDLGRALVKELQALLCERFSGTPID